MRVINIGNPLALVEVGFYDTQGLTRGVAVSGDLAYVADFSYFGIYDCSAALSVNPWEKPLAPPLAFALHPCSPNPFNASTAISYQLSAVSHVKLTVYDTAGRLVATLVDGMREAGMHEVTFDGLKLASGIYLANLEAGEFTAVQKLALMR